MKKLFAILMAVSFILTLSVSAFAEGEGSDEVLPEGLGAELEISYTTSNSLGTFNYGGTVTFDISLDITSIPADLKDVSVVLFEMYFDPYVLERADNGGIDEETGSEGDYSSILEHCPEGWEALGGGDDGWFEFCIWDESMENPMKESASFSFSLPFRVLEDANADSTLFELREVIVYGYDMDVSYTLGPVEFTIERACQPDEIAALPEYALPLEIAGYKHAANNVIYYAEEDIAIGEYISSYMEITNGQDDMNYFAIAIVNAETSKVVYCDSVIGRPQSDKSEVVIPAGHYIIGVNGNKTEDYNSFTERISVGMTAELINVNVDAMDPTEPFELSNAGFALCNPEPEIKYDSPIVYDSEESVMYIYANDLTASTVKDFFTNVDRIYGEDGTLLEDGDIVSTGDYIPSGFPDGDPICLVIIGDANGDGLVNQYDYILVKRHYFETFVLEGACFKAACIADGEAVGIYDYVYVKRIYFGTLLPESLFLEVK